MVSSLSPLPCFKAVTQPLALDVESAVHEISHPLADLEHNFPIAYVSIEHGKSICQTLQRALRRSEVPGWIICLLAGAQGVQLFSGTPDPRARNDYQEARSIALAASDDEQDAEILLQFCEVHAALFVQRRAHDIDKIASLLLKRQRMSGEEIRKLMS
jgi:hypothetical protein